MKKISVLAAILCASFIFAACSDDSIEDVIYDYCYHSLYCENEKHPNVDEPGFKKCSDELEKRYRETPSCEWRFIELYRCGMNSSCKYRDEPAVKCGPDRMCIEQFRWHEECKYENREIASCIRDDK